MGKYCIEEIKNLICNGNFGEVKKIVDNYSIEELSDVLCRVADDVKSIIVYSFVNFLLIDKELPEYHIIAAGLFSIPLFSIPGAYNVALYHVRRALELDSLSVEYREALLFFYDIPDQLVSREEALKVAQEIIKEKPDSSAALHIIDEIMSEK
jgi:hypothetical protein